MLFQVKQNPGGASSAKSVSVSCLLFVSSVASPSILSIFPAPSRFPLPLSNNCRYPSLMCFHHRAISQHHHCIYQHSIIPPVLLSSSFNYYCKIPQSSSYFIRPFQLSSSYCCHCCCHILLCHISLICPAFPVPASPLLPYASR